MVSSAGGYRKSEATRKLILQAAIAVWSSKGFAHANLQDVAAHAGVSKGVVHYHFESKEALVLRVFDVCVDALMGILVSAWEGAESPIDRIRSALRAVWNARIEGGAELRVLSDVVAMSLNDPALREVVAKRLHDVREGLAVMFVEAFRQAGLRPRVPAAAIALLISAVLDGVALMNRLDPPTQEEADDAYRALELSAFALFEL